MPAKNENLDLPKSKAVNDPVLFKFPPTNPIFWGPNQTTKYPDTYNEPDGWREFEVLSIPATIRFITGAGSTPAIHRTIGLGTTPLANCRIMYTSAGGPGIGTNEQDALKTFVLFDEISALYSANMGSQEVIDLLTYSQNKVRPLEDQGLINFNYMGGPNAVTVDGFPYNMYQANIGPPAVTAGINPGDAFPFQWETAHPNQLWEQPVLTALYWFLNNHIADSQANFLILLMADSGIVPSTPAYDYLLALAALSSGPSVSGLILQP